MALSREVSDPHGGPPYFVTVPPGEHAATYLDAFAAGLLASHERHHRIATERPTWSPPTATLTEQNEGAPPPGDRGSSSHTRATDP